MKRSDTYDIQYLFYFIPWEDARSMKYLGSVDDLFVNSPNRDVLQKIFRDNQSIEMGKLLGIAMGSLFLVIWCRIRARNFILAGHLIMSAVHYI